MNRTSSTIGIPVIPHAVQKIRLLLLVPVALGVLMGCGTKITDKKRDEFFTSGSREADQRALQRMAQSEQLGGSGEGAGEKGVKKAVPVKTPADGIVPDGVTNKAARVEGKLALFDRLGGEPGISNIVSDFMPRLLRDPRVNWHRHGVKGGVFARKTVTWDATPGNVANLRKHLVQFLALATGGPAEYEGKDMASTHAGMHIENAEFDAAMGDLKASLDRLRIPNKEQKELLAIIETTRPQVVTRR